MLDVGLKTQNYARSRLKDAKLCKIYAQKRKIMQDLGLKTQNYARSRRITQNYARSTLKAQNYARPTLKNAKLCKI